MNVDFEDYLETEVFDEKSRLIGSLNCFWTDDDDQPQFLGIKLKGSPERSSLVPVTIASADERQSCIRINAPVKDILGAPSLDCDEQLDADLEEKVHTHFGLEASSTRHELHITRSRSD